ncbi:DUF4331 family protein [Nonlabens marinus]|uniref:DUF4331 domain-containing protein n=1 Tax=Nonlabens marinus S1-08 TaxID=1454201 RepID=W8VW71_9FLAO|nr:DUF4331 family protein [Nonlabens marinus]BAO56073.1 hypothetical protein NMS_2064 [Nonlabens marinus S1-08]
MKIFNIKYTIAAAALAMITISCGNDDDITGNPVTTDFTGTFVQEDQMGRPGINTVFPTTDADENAFNQTIPSNGINRWQPTFQDKVETLYNAYGASYENNILGLDLPTLTTALSLDVLQVAPNASGPTTYFASTSNFLTGRRLQDDVIDVSLILLFGGNSGARFDGQNGTPNLVSDNVGLEAGVTQSAFPYMTAPQF